MRVDLNISKKFFNKLTSVLYEVYDLIFLITIQFLIYSSLGLKRAFLIEAPSKLKIIKIEKLVGKQKLLQRGKNSKPLCLRAQRRRSDVQMTLTWYFSLSHSKAKCFWNCILQSYAVRERRNFRLKSRCSIPLAELNSNLKTLVHVVRIRLLLICALLII